MVVVILVMLASGAAVGLRQRGRVRVGTAPAPLHHHAGDVEHRPWPRAPSSRAGSRSGACPRSCGRSAADPIGWVPYSAILVGGIAIAVAVVLLPTRVGPLDLRRRRQSRRARGDGGIPVGSVLISVYVLCGLLAGVARDHHLGSTERRFADGRQLAELDSIAAVIIGGASFLGGRGTVLNALIGALMIGVIRNGMNLLNVDAFLQPS